MTTTAPATSTPTPTPTTNPGSHKPPGWQSLVPCLQLNNALGALALYERAFNAVAVHKVLSADNQKLIHASLRIEDSTLLLSDPYPDQGFPAVEHGHLWLYVADAEAAYKKAVEAGMKGVKPVQEMFWGDKTGQVDDGFGVTWVIAQHLKDNYNAALPQ